ncbi:DAPG hydrolase family protein [Spirosoma sp.]|uniref:DAPG hydrolase family protein n=1 Tax=Spirosoma sp. TaxID=1899569 RepID=UPI003B3A83E7
MKWKLPPARPFSWKMKSLDSAQTAFNTLPYGSFELLINHNVIRNVTPDMLLWWFQHIGDLMPHEGKTYPRYLIWHPIDHIHWELKKPAPDGGAGVGAHFHIVEAFGGNMKHLVDSMEEVIKLDTEGITLVIRILGMEVYRLAHRFIPVAGGTLYRSRMQVGHESLRGRWLINPVMHRFIFPRAMGLAWLKHNVEEVGNFEFFLPELYNSQVEITSVM